MRLRLNKFEKSQKTAKMIKCLRAKVSFRPVRCCFASSISFFATAPLGAVFESRGLGSPVAAG